MRVSSLELLRINFPFISAYFVHMGFDRQKNAQCSRPCVSHQGNVPLENPAESLGMSPRVSHAENCVECSVLHASLPCSVQVLGRQKQEQIPPIRPTLNWPRPPARRPSCPPPPPKGKPEGLARNPGVHPVPHSPAGRAAGRPLYPPHGPVTHE